MKGIRRPARARLAILPLALGVTVGACSFIDHFPDVVPDPDPMTSAGSSGDGSPSASTSGSTSSSGAASAGGMGGAAATTSTSSTSSTPVTSSSSASSAGSTGSGGAGGACVPAYELCATAADENCDGIGCVGAWLASARFGDVGDQRAKAVAAAGADAIFLGAATGTSELGGGPLPELGDPMIGDLLLARFTPTLSALWQKRFADTSAGGVAVTPSGDVLLAAGAIGAVDFGGGVLTGPPPPTHDAVVVRFDASGKHLWSHRWGDAADQNASAVAVAPPGDAVFAGGFAGKLGIGPGAPLTAVGTTDLFVARLDPAGASLWSESFGASGYVAQARGVAVDGAGNVIVAGFFTGTLVLGGTVLVSQGAEDIFVAKLDAGGAPLWARCFGGPGTDRASSVAIGPGDSVFVAGGFRGLVTFGALPPVATPSLGDVSGFLVKIDPGGTPLWVRSQSDPATMGTGTDQQCLGVEVDVEGNAVVTGFASGTTVFDPANPVTSARLAAGATDAFVAKYDPAGGLLWARLFGDASAQGGFSVAIGPLGTVWSTGIFAGTIDFGAMPPGALTSVGTNDIFLARLSP